MDTLKPTPEESVVYPDAFTPVSFIAEPVTAPDVVDDRVPVPNTLRVELPVLATVYDAGVSKFHATSTTAPVGGDVAEIVGVGDVAARAPPSAAAAATTRRAIDDALPAARGMIAG